MFSAPLRINYVLFFSSLPPIFSWMSFKYPSSVCKFSLCCTSHNLHVCWEAIEAKRWNSRITLLPAAVWGSPEEDSPHPPKCSEKNSFPFLSRARGRMCSTGLVNSDDLRLTAYMKTITHYNKDDVKLNCTLRPIYSRFMIQLDL